MEPVVEASAPWSTEKRRSLDMSRTSTTEHPPELGKLPFFGPPDPKRTPIHKILFLCGVLFPPLWFVGALVPVRDTDDTWAELFRVRCQAAAMMVTIVAVALLILLTAFDRP